MRSKKGDLHVSWRQFATLSVLCALFCLPAYAQNGPASGENGKIYHFIEEVSPSSLPSDLLVPSNQEPVSTEAIDIPSDLINPALIVNTIKSLWDVIKANQPVANVAEDYAQALPRGIAAPMDLAGFSDVQSHAYRLYGKNMLGMTVYDVVCTMVHQYDGSYDGKGHYLATVSVVPSKVSVMLGYKVDVKVTQVSVVNVGTVTDPVASLTMELTLTVNSAFKQSISKTISVFRGDSGQVTIIGAPGTPSGKL